jgi:hypothetical protein
MSCEVDLKEDMTLYALNLTSWVGSLKKDQY